jgi:hypothetical protein
MLAHEGVQFETEKSGSNFGIHGRGHPCRIRADIGHGDDVTDEITVTATT